MIKTPKEKNMIQSPMEIVAEYMAEKEELIAEELRNMIYDILDETFDPKEIAATVLPTKEEIQDMMWRALEDYLLPF